MEGIVHQTVEVNGIKMHVAEKGQGPVVLLLHGFPELWYSWRHQILGLAHKGYRAVAPDLRGYGDTDAPDSVSSYSIFHLDSDLVALIDVLSGPGDNNYFRINETGWNFSTFYSEKKSVRYGKRFAVKFP